jgi:hypothetical protein
MRGGQVRAARKMVLKVPPSRRRPFLLVSQVEDCPALIV